MAPGRFPQCFPGKIRQVEHDLVLEFAPDQRWAIEIKRGLTQPKPSAGFHNGSEDIEAKRRLVIYPGKHSFIQGGNVETIPLQVLMDELCGLDD